MNEFFQNRLVGETHIGRGGFGFVKSGFYPNHGTIAFKIQFDERDGYKENEIDILKSIRHQNIVQILGPLYKSEDNRTLVGYVMEKMETSLEHGRCPLFYPFVVINNREIIYNDGKIFNWMEQVCSGLMFLHNVKDLIHRDVKPLNILFASGLINLKLCDFGTTKSANISTQSFTGSYFYMSPEVMESKKYNHSTDIYSLGITLWVVKTRRAPYDSIAEFLKSSNGYRPSIEEIDDRRTREIIEQCWAQEPTDRPAAGKLQQRFAQLIKKEGVLKAIIVERPQSIEEIKEAIVNEERIQDEEDNELKSLEGRKKRRRLRQIEVNRNYRQMRMNKRREERQRRHDEDQQEFLKSINGYRPSIEEIDNQRTRGIIEQCCAQEPTDRPTAEELQQRLAQLLIEDPIPPSLYLKKAEEQIPPQVQGTLECFYEDQVTDNNFLGRGVYGDVCNGSFPKFGYAAFKVFHNTSRPYTVSEIDNLKDLNHQNIIRIYGVLWKSEKERVLKGFVMEKMTTSLRSVIESRSIQYDDLQIYSWVEQAASGLMYLHETKNMAHRDLKPENMLLDSSHRNLKLCDFGMAKNMGLGSLSYCVGSGFYRAPEVIINQPYTTSADIYSLGISLWHVKVRKQPYDSWSLDVTHKIAYEEYRPRREEVNNQEMLRIIEKCWSADPCLRPSAKDLHQTFITL